MTPILSSKSFGAGAAALFTILLLWLAGNFQVAPANAAVFLIHAPNGKENDIRKTLEAYLQRLTSALDVDYPDTIKVVVAVNQSQLAFFARGLPDWGAAVTLKEERLIVVKSPWHFQIGKRMEELLGHELCHLVLDRAVGGRWLPRWFEEGYCQLVSGEWRLGDDWLMAKASWGGGLLPLVSLEGVNHFGGAKAALAYAESYAAVSLLASELGPGFFSDFFLYYREGEGFFDAFQRASGYSYYEWVARWQQTAARKYRVVVVLFDSRVLFPLLALLFLFIYLVKSYQTKKKKRQWAEMEKYRLDDEMDST